MSIKTQMPSSSKLYTVYEEVPECFLDETDLDIYFYHNILNFALIDNRIVRVRKESNKNPKFHLKNLQLFWTRYVSFWNNTIKLSTFELYTLYPNQNKRLAIHFFKDELFAHYFQDLKEHRNRQISLSFRFERNKECCLSVKKFQIVGEENVLTEIINLRDCEVHRLHQNCYYSASKCASFDSNYVIWLKNFCSGTLPRSNYSEIHRRCDLPK